MISPAVDPPLPATPPDGPATGWLLVFPDRRRQAEQGVLILVVVGEVDVSTAGQLRDALLEVVAERPEAVVVDLTGLGFCALAGLDALHAGLDAAQAAGVAMTMRGMSRQLSWLHRTFPRTRQVRAPSSVPSPAPALDRATDHAMESVIDSAGGESVRMEPNGFRAEHGPVQR